jgi:hypothetical protein
MDAETMGAGKSHAAEFAGRRHFSFKWASPLLLLLLWTVIGMLFALAWYLPAGAEGHPIAFKTAIIWNLLDSYAWLALSPLIFFLQRRFRLEVDDGRNYFVHLLLAVGVAVLHFSAFICLDWLLDPLFATRFITIQRAFAQLIFYRTITGIVTYALIVAVLCARDYYCCLRSERERRATLEYQLTRAELSALRMQLHPHFLFNVLHSVSALIEERPGEAIRMIARLGTFLRATLEARPSHMVSLGEEVRFLEQYFEIEQVRVGERVRFIVQVAPASSSVPVPNLILQPLVENALRHGAWKELQSMCITVESRIVGDSVEIVVRNEVEKPLPLDPKPIREGLGLANVRSRLQQLYPGRFRFTYGWISNGLFQVSLVLPLEPVPASL